MRVVTRSFYNVARPDLFRIIPIGDSHVGAAACDEARLKSVVDSVATDKNTYWIAMGDYCDFINRTDPRFSAGSLAPWLSQFEPDIAAAQRDKFLEYIKPIAHKCLGVVEGNHETAILRKYERNIYSDIVNGIKRLGGFEPTEKLAIGYSGWIILKFYRGEKKSGVTTIKVRVHHGFGGGKLAGAKALNMERFIWTNDCDIALMGHTHERGMPLVREITAVAGSRITSHKRIGAWTGTFLQTHNPDGPSTYSEVKGYFPLPTGGIEILLRPGAKQPGQRIRIVTGI